MSRLPPILALFAFAAWPAVAGSAEASGAGETYAIVIGYNGATPGLPVLHFADDDAVRFARLFAGLGGGAGPRRIWLLTEIDQETQTALARAEVAVPSPLPPTRSAFHGAIAELGRTLAARAPRGPRSLYVIYAGHGLNGRVLLKPEAGGEAAITGAELVAALSELGRADPGLHMFLFLDACRSQSLFTARDAESGPDLSTEISELERRAGAVEVGVLTAATTGKPAGEVRGLQSGYFSHALASGLAGAADSDGDEVVSFGELVAFVAQNTQGLTGQRPWFDPPGGRLGASTIDHRGRLPRLLLPAAAGRYVVEAEPGFPVLAEAVTDGRRPVKLALPPGRYRIRKIIGDNGTPARSTVLALGPGDVVDAARLAWEETSPEDAPAAARGVAGVDAGLVDDLGFRAPFTPEVVSILAAGYQSGREPSSVVGRPSFAIGVASTVGAAPLDLGGAEGGAILRLRRKTRWLVGGVRLGFATSSHEAGAERYRFERWSLLAEGGLRLSVASRIEATLTMGAGGAAALRRAGGKVSGDPFGPALAGGAGAQIALGGRWSFFVDVHALVHWISVDGSRNASVDPAVDTGLAWEF